MNMEERNEFQSELGSIAAESMKVSGIFDVAQKAADEYLESIKKRSAEQEARLARIDEELAQKSKDTAMRCEKLLNDTQAECDRLSTETKAACDELYTRTRTQCDDMLTNTEKLCMQREESSKEKCREMEQSIETKCMNLAQQTKNKCNELEAETDAVVEEKWTQFQERLEKFIAAKEDLKEVMDFMMKQKENAQGSVE
jgi:hypothetical protein